MEEDLEKAKSPDEHQNGPISAVVARVEAFVHDNHGKCQLYFVVHHRQHYVPFRISFDEGHIEYGALLFPHAPACHPTRRAILWAYSH